MKIFLTSLNNRVIMRIAGGREKEEEADTNGYLPGTCPGTFASSGSGLFFF
jgi:hypothetical protein